MSCECHDEGGIPGVTAEPKHAIDPRANPARVNYHYHKCECGCLELRERVVRLEQNLGTLALIIENKDKAAGENPEQLKRRWIGDSTA